MSKPAEFPTNASLFLSQKYNTVKTVIIPALRNCIVKP